MHRRRSGLSPAFLVTSIVLGALVLCFDACERRLSLALPAARWLLFSLGLPLSEPRPGYLPDGGFTVRVGANVGCSSLTAELAKGLVHWVATGQCRRTAFSGSDFACPPCAAPAGLRSSRWVRTDCLPRHRDQAPPRSASRLCPLGGKPMAGMGHVVNILTEHNIPVCP